MVHCCLMSPTTVLGIDCRFASTHSGLGTYTRGLVLSLVTQSVDSMFVLFVRSAEEEWLSTLPKTTVRIVIADFPHYSFSEQLLFPRIIRSSGCTLFFSPQFNVPLLCPVPFVCTVHDLILHHYPNQASFLKRSAYRFLLWFAVTRARIIFTVSSATRADLLSRYSHIESKVHTVYPGIDSTPLSSPQDSLSALREKYQLSHPFFLYVGNCKEHKNVPLLIDAFLAMGVSTHMLILVCSGKECSALPYHPRIRRLEDVSAEELKALYSSAVALVTATKLEGFGLPILEAMAHDCPVIATDVPSVREISQGHALVVPQNRELLTSALMDARDPDNRNQDHILFARRHAETFTFKRSAREVLAHLRSL